jgi:predicted transcriptional regulator
MLSACRRDGHQRAKVVKQLVNRLRQTTSCSIQSLADAAGDMEESVVRRVMTRLAVRGLVRIESNGCWTATDALRSNAKVLICRAEDLATIGPDLG